MGDFFVAISLDFYIRLNQSPLSSKKILKYENTFSFHTSFITKFGKTCLLMITTFVTSQNCFEIVDKQSSLPKKLLNMKPRNHLGKSTCQQTIQIVSSMKNIQS